MQIPKMGVFAHFYLILCSDKRSLRFSALTSVGALFLLKKVQIFTKGALSYGYKNHEKC